MGQKIARDRSRGTVPVGSGTMDMAGMIRLIGLDLRHEAAETLNENSPITPTWHQEPILQCY